MNIPACQIIAEKYYIKCTDSSESLERKSSKVLTTTYIPVVETKHKHDEYCSFSKLESPVALYTVDESHKKEDAIIGVVSVRGFMLDNPRFMHV